MKFLECTPFSNDERVCLHQSTFAICALSQRTHGLACPSYSIKSIQHEVIVFMIHGCISKSHAHCLVFPMFHDVDVLHPLCSWGTSLQPFPQVKLMLRSIQPYDKMPAEYGAFSDWMQWAHLLMIRVFQYHFSIPFLSSLKSRHSNYCCLYCLHYVRCLDSTPHPFRAAWKHRVSTFVQSSHICDP